MPSFKVNQANTLWWNGFSVLDVLLLLFYSHLKDDLSPKAVFYINNIIWFLGLDIYHLYLTVKLWMRDMPSIKDVQREIAFYPRKPGILEPRRPMLTNTFSIFDCKRDQKTRWTEIGSPLPGRSAGEETTHKERSIKNCKTRIASLNKGQKESKRSTPNPNLPPVSD